MAFGGEQPDRGALVFQQCVGGHGHTVDDAFGAREQGAAIHAELTRHALQGLHHADGLIVAGGGHLGEAGGAVRAI